MRNLFHFWGFTPQVRMDAAPSENTVTRSELETLFAYELRVANSDMSKIKVYKRTDRFKSPKIVPLGIEHQDPATLEMRVTL